MKGLYVLKEKRIYKRELPLWGSLLAAVLLAGCITLLALWCQPNALRTVLAGFKAQPLLIVLNALPIGLLLLAFAFLFRNIFYSGALVNFFVCALSLANRVKIEVRDEPVFPRDFSLLREVGSAIQSYDIRYPVKAIAVVVLTTALLVGLGVLFPSRPVSFAALKAKLKVLAEKVEEYRSTEEAMRQALLTAQKMAAKLVQEAQTEKEKILADAQVEAQAEIHRLDDERRAAEKELQAAQEKTAAFIRRSEELCQAQSAFLQSLPELDFVPEQPESPAAEPQADVVSAIEQDILSKYIDAPEEKGAGSAVTDEPTIKLPPVDGSAIPSDFRLSLDELKFGRNYSGDK